MLLGSMILFYILTLHLHLLARQAAPPPARATEPLARGADSVAAAGRMCVSMCMGLLGGNTYGIQLDPILSYPICGCVTPSVLARTNALFLLFDASAPETPELVNPTFQSRIDA